MVTGEKRLVKIKSIPSVDATLVGVLNKTERLLLHNPILPLFGAKGHAV